MTARASDVSTRLRRALEVALARAPHGFRPVGPHAATLDLGAAQLRVELAPPGFDGALAVTPGLAVTYRIEGTLARDAAPAARTALLALLDALADADADLGMVSSPAALDAALRAGRSPEPLALDAAARRDPAALRGVVVASFERAVESGRRLPAVDGLPPCLALEQRPALPPHPLVPPDQSPSGACARCGAALRCPSSGGFGVTPRDELRPLAHGDETAAFVGYLAALSAAFPETTAAARDRIDAIVAALLDGRRGLLALPPLPLEVSVRVRGGVLEPTLRLTEYSPDYARHPALRGAHTAARRTWSRTLPSLAGRPDASDDYGAWLELVEAVAGPTVEVSLGFEVDLRTATCRFQAYAHLSPDTGASAPAMTRLLAFSGCGDAPALSALVQREASAVELVAFSPSEDSPRRQKLYVALPGTCSDGGTGLSAATLGDLSRFAGPRGLAVYDASGPRGAWLKWDFPVRTHYQAAGALPAAFLGGLGEDSARRARALLDPGRFAPWTTWLSVDRDGAGVDARTIYFVPR